MQIWRIFSSKINIIEENILQLTIINNYTYMEIKERLLQYLDYKSITPTKAETTLCWGKGALIKAKCISVDKAGEFLLHFDDLSAEWLLRGTGDMILASAEQSQTGTPSNSSAFMIPFEEYKKSIAEKDEVIKDQAHKIGMLEHELQLFTSKKQTALGMENASTAAEHQMSIPEAE